MGRPTDRWVLDHLPAGALAVDETAMIVAASERAAALVGRPLETFVGSSILEYVDPDAIWAYAAAVNLALDTTSADVYGGPVRISIQGPDGNKVACDLWNSNQVGEDGPQVMVLLLCEQTVAVGVAEAAALAATGADFGDVAIMAAGALGGYPVVADAAVFVRGPDGRPEVAATKAPRSLVDGTAGDEHWTTAIEARERVLFVEEGSVPPPLGDLMAAAGYRSLWVEPIVLGDEPASGAIAIFRRFLGEPTVNELASGHSAAGVLALAQRR